MRSRSLPPNFFKFFPAPTSQIEFDELEYNSVYDAAELTYVTYY